jgi:hypothetical protein
MDEAWNQHARTRGCILIEPRIGVTRAVAFAALLLLVGMAVAGGVQAQEGAAKNGVHLFTVTSATDEIVIGLSEAEVPALASRAPVTVVADLLAADGRLPAWRYAPSRGEDGVIRQAPVHRIAIFAAGTIRLEAYLSDQEVLAPAE